MTDNNRRLHILVEGQTEESIVRQILEPHLAMHGWWVEYSIVTTKRPAGRAAHKGGVTSWPQLEREIRLLLRNTSLDVLTTLLDYYAFPPDAPGMASRPSGSPLARVLHVERSLSAHFNDSRLLANLVLHETEAWVFAAREQLGWLLGGAIAARMDADVAAAGGPEGVNDDPATAPSKRLARYCSGYIKTQDGPLAIADLGVEGLRRQCPHLNDWLRRLEA
jgi:hypothetical protein